MTSVSLAFVLNDDPTVKMLGIGLAVVVLVDATIVRVVIVPATTRLLGDANWWLPKWLQKLLPDLDIEGEHNVPAPDFERPEPEREMVLAASHDT